MTVFTHALSTNNYGAAAIIVDTNPANGTHTTIQGAITAAVAPATIMIRPGTYTENLTHKDGVNVVGYVGDGNTPTVTIIGTNTFTAAGKVTMSGVRLQTNSSFVLTVSGSAASNFVLSNCYLNCTNNTGISFTTSNATARIKLLNCQGDLGTTGIAFLASSSAGTLEIFNSQLENSGVSTTSNTVSAGRLNIEHGRINTIATSSAGTIFISFCEVNREGANQIGVDHQGSVNGEIRDCRINAGTSSAVNVSAGNRILCHFSELVSSNTNCVSGAGNFTFGVVSFTNSTVIQNSVVVGALNEIKTSLGQSPVQPCFVAYRSTNQTAFTGNGGSATIVYDTEVLDQNTNYNNATGVFTAPRTGTYHFTASVRTISIAATAANATLTLVVSSYTGPAVGYQLALTGFNPSFSISEIINLTVNDTVQVTYVINGMPGNTAGVGGAATDLRSMFSGYLLC